MPKLSVMYNDFVRVVCNGYHLPIDYVGLRIYMVRKWSLTDLQAKTLVRMFVNRLMGGYCNG